MGIRTIACDPHNSAIVLTQSCIARNARKRAVWDRAIESVDLQVNRAIALLREGPMVREIASAKTRWIRKRDSIRLICKNVQTNSGLPSCGDPTQTRRLQTSTTCL